MNKNKTFALLTLLLASSYTNIALAQDDQEPPPPPTAEELEAEAEDKANAKRQSLYEQAVAEDKEVSAKLEKEPFSGITVGDSDIQADLYPLQSVDADTSDITALVIDFIDLFDDSDAVEKLVDEDIQSINWRKWRADAQQRTHGVSLLDMSDKQKKAAMALLEDILSIEGYEEVASIMALNTVTGELNSEPEAYNENMYWFSIFGRPKEEQPWGLQVDGNNLSLNFVVVGDQVVLSPILLAAEPTLAPAGTQYAGETALQFKRDGALRFIQSLDEAQQEQIIISQQKTENQMIAGAFTDNTKIPLEGMNAKNFTNTQKQDLLNLIRLWTGDLRDEHAEIWTNSIQAHIDETYVAWWGGIASEDTFYLRIVSPVIVIELDHQVSAALKDNVNYAGGKPRIDHIKSIVRQPNGNDYGKALLTALETYQKQAE